MKNRIIPFVCLMFLGVSCAQKIETASNKAAKDYFDAWVYTYYPELRGKAVEPWGYYILSDVEGTGDLIGDSGNTPYYRAEFTVRNLEGKVIQTSKEKISRQIGTYEPYNFYGPNTFARINNSAYAGVDYAIQDMRVGGEREFLIPGYLITNSRFDNLNGYLNGESVGFDCRYHLKITERIPDIVTWECDSLKRYMKKTYGYTDEQCEKDTLKAGYYKIVNIAPSGEKFSRDTTIYINYVARRLDGQVFDTTIEDTAKFYKLYNSAKKYAPISAQIKKEDYTNTTINSGSSVIDGFAYLLDSMGPFETSTGIFYSKYGYGASGSGLSIPAYCPLSFQISVVAKPSD